jgi:hypothetical protein
MERLNKYASENQKMAERREIIVRVIGRSSSSMEEQPFVRDSY